MENYQPFSGQSNHHSEIKSNKLTSLIFGLLVFIFGLIGGYRVGVVGTLPFNLSAVKLQAFLNSTLPKTNSGSLPGSSLLRVTSRSETDSKLLEQADFSIFWEVWSLLDREYLDQEKLVPFKMVDGAVSGLTASLDDPYTMYLPREDNQRSGEDLAGSFYGVGIELGYKDGVLAVIAPLKDSPAAKAGVEAGDYILKVADKALNFEEETTGWNLNKAVDHIRGKKDTVVTLTLLRKDHNSNTPFTIDITRGEIVVKSVELSFVSHQNKRVAHLVLSKFGERTLEEWNQAVKDILTQTQPVDGIVLDMRNNPGGLFDLSIDIAGDFIGKEIAVSQASKSETQDFRAHGSARLAKYPAAVLVNKGSASASEIVAGALKDQVQAKLVGEKTFGKGTVQDRRELSNGAGIHITIARWLTPNGSWIHETGLPVDIEIKNNPDTPEDEVLLKGIEALAK